MSFKITDRTKVANFICQLIVNALHCIHFSRETRNREVLHVVIIEDVSSIFDDFHCIHYAAWGNVNQFYHVVMRFSLDIYACFLFRG